MRNNYGNIFILLLLINAIACDNFRVINYTSVWNKTDELNLKQAKKYCYVKSSGQDCLKVFIKKNTNTYNGICGWVR